MAFQKLTNLLLVQKSAVMFGLIGVAANYLRLDGSGASELRNKLTIRFKLNPDSTALVRQSCRNADAERRLRRGLEVLSGRFSLGPFPGLKAPAILFSPFGRPDLTDNVYYRWSSG